MTDVSALRKFEETNKELILDDNFAIAVQWIWFRVEIQFEELLR